MRRTCEKCGAIIIIDKENKNIIIENNREFELMCDDCKKFIQENV